MLQIVALKHEQLSCLDDSLPFSHPKNPIVIRTYDFNRLRYKAIETGDSGVFNANSLLFLIGIKNV